MAFNWLRSKSEISTSETTHAQSPSMAATIENCKKAASSISLQCGTRHAFSPYSNYGSLVHKSYLENVIAYRCIRMVSENASSIPVCIYHNKERLVDHPLLDILKSPNPLQGNIDFMDNVFSYLQTAGNIYIEAVTTDGNHPIELYTLRPDRIRIILDSRGWPKMYEYCASGKKCFFPLPDHGPSPILHLKTFHPLNDHYGLSPLEAASKAIDIHNAASCWNKSLLDNAARPSGAIIYRGQDGAGQLSTAQYERLVEELENNHQGTINAGRPMLLEGGLDWKTMGFSPSDMEFMETKNSAAREIASAFGVPPMLLGLPGDNTYSNYQEANRAFIRGTILPLIYRVYSAFSSWISQYYQESLKLEPILDALPALSGERESLWKRISAADFLSKEEKRELLGLGNK
jgi:HK97 family phage portal protein